MRRPDHIRKIVLDRGIEHLLHFTMEKNLRSILEHGLLPRDELAERDDIMAFVNDPYRSDGHEDAICLTITRYQAPMFRKCLRDNPRENWVMLVIDPVVLWEKPCLFCDGNASSTWIKKTQRNLSTAYALSAMFDDYSIPKRENGTWVNVSKRGQDGMPDWVPTNAQAEVLVKASIPCDRILGVWVESDKQGERIAAMLKTVSESERPDLIIREYSFDICDGA